MRSVTGVLLLTLVAAVPAAAQTVKAPARDTAAGRKVVVPAGPLGNSELLSQSYHKVLALRNADPLADAFFPPELVMQHQQRIGLNAEQRAAIIRAIQEAQPRFVEAQWQLEPETTALAELVQSPRIDQQLVLQQIDRVLDIERRIKRSQIELLIAIKNQLTEAQQAQLAQLGGRRTIT